MRARIHPGESRRGVTGRPLVGRTITKAFFSARVSSAPTANHETAFVWLDDGRILEFVIWNRDERGALATDVVMEESDAETGAASGAERLRRASRAWWEPKTTLARIGLLYGVALACAYMILGLWLVWNHGFSG